MLKSKILSEIFRCVFQAQKIYEKAFLENSLALEYVHGAYITKEMCDKVNERRPWLLKYVFDWYVTQGIVKKQLIIISEDWNIFLISVRHNRWTKNLLIIISGHWNFFLISIRHKRSVKRLLK